MKVSKTLEKIKKKEQEIERIKNRIKNDQDKIRKIEKEIEQLKNTEIQGVLKELNMPLTEVLEFLRDLKK